ncbi:3-oxoacyl-[acyl-carrier-protein] reductase FabG-like [Pieris brassicae]|uniref:3-oxoacyl-[acyl-carrier-protein] reductase FabG-like n=1 Tax=Pieris brassicae TaxID=7116 RepID=UPI001E6603C6|nr:3-oxoacyl-[acyl-carrier-protein] reductase FabG-like [Pieris brassicae]
MSFVKKVVLVIGASSGIGASTAIEFTKEGASVVIVGRNQDKLQTVAAECKKNGLDPLVIKADISNDDDVTRIVQETIDKYGKIDILVNNAGIGRFASIFKGNLMNVFDEIIKTNLRGIMKVTTLVAPHIIKTKGNIVNISSVAGQAVPKNPLLTSYAISKAGLDVFTKAAAVELAPHGVRVNAISPGPVYTDILINAGLKPDEGAIKTFDEIKTALNRVSTPEEVANMIMYLAGDKCIGVTGSNFLLDNGALLT